MDRQVGDCWSVDGSQKLDDIRGTGQTSVTCDSSPTATTFLVGTVVGAPAKSYLSRGFLEASTIAELPDRMIRQVTDECEASLRKWGSPLAQPEWQSFPSPLAKLADDVAARPMEYRLCVETPLHSILPTAGQGVVADCTTARWVLKPVSLGVTFGEIYTGDVKAKAMASERCRAANPGAFAVSAPLVSKFQWKTPEPTPEPEPVPTV